MKRHKNLNNTKIKPLQANDKVALFCSGSICVSPQHPQLCSDYLQQRFQLRSEFTPETHQGFAPQQRAEFFLQHLFNDENKLLMALRGGEGTADILPFIHQHQQQIRSLTPKWLLGFSDVTALLVYFAQCYGWPTLHSSSALQFALHRVDQASEQATMQLLFGQPQAIALPNLKPLNEAAEQPIMIEGKLTGGCLSIVDISIKDIWEIDTRDKILFFEDCGEKAHKILRLLKYFSRIGLFTQVKAVILGDFSCDAIGAESEQADNREAILKSLSSFANHHSFPVLYTNQFGHGKTNLPLLYNYNYRLQLGKNAQLQL